MDNILLVRTSSFDLHITLCIELIDSTMCLPLRCHHKNEIRLRQIYLEVLPIGAILGRYVEEHL